MATRTRHPAGAADQLAEYRRKRDFKKTAEPAGDSKPRGTSHLRFVVQKHAASHLHFDLRLELDGVMKSWAVPKGPSTDPSVKRLAMQVEDHPIEYNTFEGTIPEGEYGGGTVMLWDRGTYAPDESSGDDEAAVREMYARGNLKITFFGKRMRGSWSLVRMKHSRDGQSSSKPQWLVIKHRDEFASTDDIVGKSVTSVDTGRTMDEIASGKSKVWRSNRTSQTASSHTASSPRSHAVAVPDLEPMYASIGTEIPGEGWTFEPKYDGVRVLAFVTPSDVRLLTRNGKDKSAQFPEITEALESIAAKKRKSFVVDGEIVALIDGKPARFQELQSRLHVRDPHLIERHRTTTPACLILFDILMSGDKVLLDEPWSARKAELLKQFGKLTSDHIQLTESIEGDGKKMLELARKQGWEGIIAKRVTSTYQPGVRSKSWLKLKIEFRQEFVVGGFTEPHNSRQHLGALLLGYFDHGRLIYVGHTGGGFTGAELAEMYRRLKPLERKTSPFAQVPRTNEKVHWVRPEVVVEVKFSEWTADGKLRQPIYLGIRDDKYPEEVGREKESVQKKEPATTEIANKTGASKSRARKRIYAERKLVSSPKSTPAKKSRSGGAPRASELSRLVRSLQEIEENGGSGKVEVEGRDLAVTNLDKVFFPRKKLTKGDLMRYYATVAPLILPVMKDRPLVLKRFPNGVGGPSFFQQNAGDTPEGVRVETIQTQGGSTNLRIVGGDLYTLLYTVQLGSISVDPWHSRIQSLDFADYAILDLDPGPRATFSRVIQVARLVKETLDRLGLHAALKTSGSSGIHVYLSLPPKTPNEAATLVAQIIATRVTEANPKVATIERSVKARGATTVYVDYLQNIIGKTVAAAYSARANPDALVSTPLRWEELTDDLDPRDFTIETAPARFAKVGDLWAAALKKPNSLKALG